MVNRSSYARDSNSAFNSKSISDVNQTNALAFRYAEQQFDALFKKLKSVSVTLEKLSLMALSTTETVSSDPVNIIASHSQFLSALLRSYFKHGYHFKGYKTNNRSVSNSQPLNDNNANSVEKNDANNGAINQALDIRGTLSLSLIHI